MTNHEKLRDWEENLIYLVDGHHDFKNRDDKQECVKQWEKIINLIKSIITEIEAHHQEEMPEYNFAQLRLLVHALEMLDTSEYDLGYTETHRYLIERFRKQLKKYEK